MCYALIGLAITAASAITTYVGQSQQASAQRKFQRANSLAEVERSKAEMTQIRGKQSAENEARALEMAKVGKETKKQQATARTIAGEAGVTGPSVDALLNDYAAQEAAIYSQSQRQAELDNIYTEQQLAASRLGTTSNLARINEPISRPSPLAAILQIGSGYLDASSVAQKRGGWTK